ncbi:asparagine synthetase B family protein (plasmid) [Asticcacaulis sp. DW145]|uniref:asparagine synthase-related protein n=1 Tax=Asticcacaulis sp. DW145 TaxID=3095608 RepID=UPI0030854D38|nr:asparagine synthetase B family protein [Asticcacaulis sp. DW145]
MATRYLAIVSATADEWALVPKALEALTGLTASHVSSSLTVFVEYDRDIIKMEGTDGLAIGTVFSREDRPKRISKFGAAQTARLVRSSGRALMKEYWGGYVAFVPSEDGNISIIRDPSAQAACYYLFKHPFWVFASDVEALISSGFFEPIVDWRALAHQLRSAGIKSTRTALTGLFELLPGFALSLQSDKSESHPYWSPWDHVGKRMNRKAGEIRAELKDTISGAIGAWAGQYANILLGISGGLDSSVVAAALAARHSSVTFMTMATRTPDGDERVYARVLAHSLGIPLIEKIYEPSEVDFLRGVSLHLPRPMGGAMSQVSTQVVKGVLPDGRDSAYFTGRGGDNVFCYSQSATPLLDRIYTEGLTPAVLTTIRDICDLSGASVWDVVAMALRRHRARSNAYSWRRNNRFLTEATATTPLFDHPWLDLPDSGLPGKAVHIAMLLRIIDNLEPSARNLTVDEITPLVSQPIVEAALAIPTWEWLRGGRNRSPVRDAYSDDLPREILYRKGKAGPDTFATDLLAANMTAVREHLLDGCLCYEGLVDRTALELSLGEFFHSKTNDAPRLLQLAEAESWARHWTRKVPVRKSA